LRHHVAHHLLAWLAQGGGGEEDEVHQARED